MVPGRGTPVGDLAGRLRLTEELTVGSDFRGPAPLIAGARPQELRLSSGSSCRRFGVLWSCAAAAGEQERALVVTRRVFGHRRRTLSDRNSWLRCGVSLTIGWSGRGWDKVPFMCAVPRATQPKR